MKRVEGGEKVGVDKEKKKTNSYMWRI